MNPASTGTIVDGWSYVTAAYTIYVATIAVYAAWLFVRARRAHRGVR